MIIDEKPEYLSVLINRHLHYFKMKIPEGVVWNSKYAPRCYYEYLKGTRFVPLGTQLLG